MKSGSQYLKIMPKILAIVATIFGLATLMAGGNVLAGADPGYIVFRPLLIYNIIMGIGYIAGGVLMWCNLNKGKYAAAAIFSLNLLVLGIIVYLYTTGSAIAINSLQAMTFRTMVWLLLFLALAWLSRRKQAAGTGTDRE